MTTERSFFEILSLCLRSRCPVCAKGHLFRPFHQIGSLANLCMPPDKCDCCGFRFRREPGYYFGVLTPVLPMLSLATGLVFVIASYLWGRPTNATELLPAGAIGTAIGFVFCFRPAIAIFISFDHAIDPPKPLT